MRPAIEKKLFLAFLTLAAASAAAFWVPARTHTSKTSYRLVPVERGDVQAVVSATGTLEAVTTVQDGLG